jgi:hypothetical protein
MVGTKAHGDEPLDNKADPSPEGGDKEAAAAPEKEAAAEDPKSPEASEKRKAEAKDAEGRPEIVDPEADASKKLTKDSEIPSEGESLPKGLEKPDSPEVIAKAAEKKAALAKMSKQDRQIYHDVTDSIESGQTAIRN